MRTSMGLSQRVLGKHIGVSRYFGITRFAADTVGILECPNHRLPVRASYSRPMPIILTNAIASGIRQEHCMGTAQMPEILYHVNKPTPIYSFPGNITKRMAIPFHHGKSICG